MHSITNDFERQVQETQEFFDTISYKEKRGVKEVRIGCEVQLRYMSINEGVADRYTRLKRAGSCAAI